MSAGQFQPLSGCGPPSESFDADGDGPAGTAHTKTSAPDSVLDTDRRNTSDNHTGD